MPDESRPFPLSEVLESELGALGLVVPDLTGLSESEKRRRLYSTFYGHGLTALCLSGGGIRSASFSLGIIQGLAEKGLLSGFNYLSTVSGGGYIGCWLSAWLYHTKNAATVLAQLRPRRADADIEPAALAHLREYSAYLTPVVGPFSADLWAAVAIVGRNLLLNWLILVPAIALPVVAIKFLAALSRPAAAAPGWLAGLVAAFVFALGSLSLGYKLRRLYAGDPLPNAQVAQRNFLWLSLLPAMLAGFCAAWLAERGGTPADALAGLAPSAREPFLSWSLMALFALAVYAAGSIGASPRFHRRLQPQQGQLAASHPLIWQARDMLSWGIAVVVFGTVVWSGIRVYSAIRAPANLPKEVLLVIFGMPWFLLATLLAQTTYVLLRSYSRRGDAEREWLGRASGWHLIAGLAWIVLSAVVLLGPELYYNPDWIGKNAGKVMSAMTAVTGAITAFLGKSGLTPAQGQASGAPAIMSNVMLAIAGPIFALLLVVLLSVGLDWPILGHQPFYSACLTCAAAVPGCGAGYWLMEAVALIAVALTADFFVNVNKFSLHALYRNRLVRAFLGGARAVERRPDGFTGFDWYDDLRVASLWGDGPWPDWRPFHVINMTLNLTATENLAWQQRKAMSFTVTPKFCGAADLGYRSTASYGNPHGGMGLGTSMAISGAAVSPNMGYHSSTSISFLLTLFNVRLGCWLGNPGEPGGRLPCLEKRIKRFLVGGRRPLAPYRQEAPWLTLPPLIDELFGLTTDARPYVYLSDGGHFENLGLYEMVRRRCKWIVIVDADQDPARGFGNLGDAVRKCWIDLGVRISFPNADLLEATAEAKPAEIPYFALGTVEYVSDGDPIPEGRIFYIKPAVRGDESAADVIAYKRANPTFPNQSTENQWFDEPQLEAYRALGYLIVTTMFDAAAGLSGGAPATIEQWLTRIVKIDPKTLKAGTAPEYT